MATDPERLNGANNVEQRKLTEVEFKVFTPFSSLDVTLRKNPHEIEFFGLSRALLSEEYTTFHKDYDQTSRNNPALYYDILDKICEDKYTISPYSRTKAAEDADGKFAGTMRFTQGNFEREHPLESMNLLTPTDDNVWPHHADGLTDDQVGEFGRVAIAREQRRLGNTRAVLYSLFQGGFRDARAMGIKQIYTVMPTVEGRTQLLDHLIALGMEPEPIHTMRLRTEDPTVREITETFSRYWTDLKPVLYRIHVPAEQAA